MLRKFTIGLTLVLLIVGSISMTCSSSSSKQDQALADQNRSKATMKEKIMSFRSNGNSVEVAFSKSAALYQLPVDGEHFLVSMEAIAKAYQGNTDVTYQAEGNTLIRVILD